MQEEDLEGRRPVVGPASVRGTAGRYDLHGYGVRPATGGVRAVIRRVIAGWMLQIGIVRMGVRIIHVGIVGIVVVARIHD